MNRSLTARQLRRTRNHETRYGQTYTRPPFPRSAERVAGNSFPVAAGTEVREPARVSDFRAPQLTLSVERVIPSELKLLDGIVAEIASAIEHTACCENAEPIALAVREAIANAVVHGNDCDPARAVAISASMNENCDFLITVKDSGPGFDPESVADPTGAPNLLTNHGTGVFLMRQLMDQVEFIFDHGTEVRMRKRRRWLE